MTVTTRASVYRDAAAHIERVGWFQGAFFEGAHGDALIPTDGPCCVAGAIAVATGDAERAFTNWDEALNPFLEFTGAPTFHHYNDAPSMTKEQIVSDLLRYADHLDTKEN